MKTKSPIIKTQKQWRAWLERNHEKENKVHLISYKKHTGKPSLSHREAMDKAICFGWIDTTVKRIDEETYQRTFVKRKPSAGWSKATLSYAKQLISQGRMTEAGLKAYELGKNKKTIDHNLPKNPDTPEDLQLLLEKNQKAKTFFQTLAPSYKRFAIWHIERAKRPETRTKRINAFMKQLIEGKKSGT